MLITSGAEVPDWQGVSQCLGVDPDIFYSEDGVRTPEAKAICAQCIVRNECLEYALENSERMGVWGGLTERERRSIKRRQRLASAAANVAANETL